MEIISLTLWLLLLVSLTGAIAQRLPAAFPLPLLQIVLGAAVGYYRGSPPITLDPELFMILFIPPLLFLDSWQLPQREFFRLKRTILGLAVGLTLLNVVVGGYVIHLWLSPLPLAVSFVLAALLSPTDVVAILAITKRLPLSSTIQYLLAGEALINDAAGLIALKFALAALITGTFSLGAALQQFVWITFGGIAVGVGTAYLFDRLRTVLLKPQLTPHTLQTLLLFLLLPFGTYLVAEHYGLSGILAVVAAGMSLSHLKSIHADSSAARLHARSFWPFLEFVFNGLIFLLLGLQIPQVLKNLSQDHHLIHQLPLPPFMAIAGITLLLLIRFSWLILPWLLTHRLDQSAAQAPWLNRSDLGTLTFSGIRGAITLAAALSLPKTLPDGTLFPARELLIVIAVGVILSTLILGAIMIPCCGTSTAQNLPDPQQLEAQQARLAILQAALQQIKRDHDKQRLYWASQYPPVLTSLNRACAGLRQYYAQRQQIEEQGNDDHSRALKKTFYGLQRNALQAERHMLYQLRVHNNINDVTFRILERDLDLKETLLDPG